MSLEGSFVNIPMIAKWMTSWRKQPAVIFGFVQGPVRWETNGGGDLWEGTNRFFLFQGNDELSEGAKVGEFAVTHLQKKSWFGFLIMWPLCFHFWISFKKQQQNADGTWLPGTEKVWYNRAGFARWDAGSSKYIVPTWYGPFNLHWD